MFFSMYVGTKFLSTKQELQTTILSWLNISRSKYETHSYKENLLYRHTLKKVPFAYLSNTDATFPTLSIYQEIKNKKKT